jgi:hypothetical protein
MIMIFLIGLSFVFKIVISSIFSELKQLWCFFDSIIPYRTLEFLTNFDNILIKILTKTNTNHLDNTDRNHI